VLLKPSAKPPLNNLSSFSTLSALSISDKQSGHIGLSSACLDTVFRHTGHCPSTTYFCLKADLLRDRASQRSLSLQQLQLAALCVFLCWCSTSYLLKSCSHLNPLCRIFDVFTLKLCIVKLL